MSNLQRHLSGFTTAILFLLPISTFAVDLTKPSTDWAVALEGNSFDLGDDTQSAGAIDLVGSDGAGNFLPALSLSYDDKGTPDKSDDEVAFRFCGDQVLNEIGLFSGTLWVGLDIETDNDLDGFIQIRGNNGVYRLSVFQAGNSSNNTPDSTTVGAGQLVKTLSLGSDLSINSTLSVDGSNSFNGDVDDDGNLDYFVSAKVNANSLITAINSLTLTGSGADVSTINSGIGFTDRTPIKVISASSTHDSSLNADICGYDGGVNSTVTYDTQGAFSPVISLSNRIPTIEANQKFTVPARSGLGVEVGTIAFTDLDGDAMTFSFTSGNNNGLFAINSGGLITVADSEDNRIDAITSDQTYVFGIEMTDGVSTVSETISIKVTVPKFVTLNASGKSNVDLVNQFLAPNSGLQVIANTINLTVANGRQVGFANDPYYGTLDNGSSKVALSNNGIFLTTGATPTINNTNSKDNTQNGSSSNDSDLTGLLSAASRVSDTNDIASLSFSFTADVGAEAIAIDFILGSDEYPAFVNSQYIDAVAVIVDGKNYARFVPTDGNISNIPPLNIGDADFIAPNNQGGTLYTGGSLVNVDNGTPLDNYSLNYNGMSTKSAVIATLDNTLPVTNGKRTHTVKIVIGDVSDQKLDTGLILSQLKIVDHVPSVGGITLLADIYENADAGTQLIQVQDSGAVTYEVVSGASGDAFFEVNSSTGWVTLKSGVSLDYESSESYTLVVKSKDGSNNDLMVSNILIEVKNVVPIASNATVTATEETDFTFNVSNFVSANGEPVHSVTIQSHNMYGGSLLYDGSPVTDGSTILAADLPKLVYKSAVDQVGSDIANFTFTINDSENGVVPGTMTIDVTPVNDAPVADNVTLIVAAGSPSAVIGFDAPVDVDSDDSLLTIQVTVLPSLGSVTLADGTTVYVGDSLTVAQLKGLKYVAPASYDGVASPGRFTYKVTDNAGAQSTGQLNITLNNDPVAAPVVNNQLFSIDENSAKGVNVGTVIATDDKAVVGYAIISGNSSNKFAIDSATGKITVNGNLDHETADEHTLVVQVVDAGGLTDTANITVTINDVNEAPAINNLDDDSVAYLIGSGDSVVIDQGVPATITDSNSNNFNSGYLTISGLSADDVISVNSEGIGAGQIGFNGSKISYEGDIIADFAVNSGTVRIDFNSNATEEAVAALLGNITYKNTNSSAVSKTISFNFDMVDSDGEASNTATVSVTLSDDVIAVNDSYTSDERAVVVLNPSVLDNDLNSNVTADRVLNFDASTDSVVNDGTWNDGSSYTWNYNPAHVTHNSLPSTLLPGITKSYDFNGSGGATFSGGSFNTFDENASSTFEIWFKPSDLTGNEVLFETGSSSDSGISIYLEDNILHYVIEDKLRDNVDLTYDLSAISTGEFIHLAAVLDMDPSSGKNDNVQLYINSSLEASAAGVDIRDWSGPGDAGLGQVAGTAIAGTGNFNGEIGIFQLHENKAFSANEVLENYNFIAKDPSLSIASVDSTGTLGNVTLNPNGTITYNPNGQLEFLNVGETANDAFTYTATDALGKTSTATVTFTITGTVNNPAVVNNVSVRVNETDSAITSAGTITATDVDNDNNKFTAATLSGTYGNLVLDVDGNWSYTANSAFDSLNVGQNNKDVFNITTVDGTAGTISVQIDGTNDAPNATNSSLNAATGATDVALNIPSPTDVDDASLTATVTALPNSGFGTITLADGTSVNTNDILTVAELTGLLYDAPASYDGSSDPGTFSYIVKDSANAAAQATVDINLNNAPVLGNYSFSIAENVALGANVGTVTGTDDNSLTYSITAGNSAGKFSIDSSTGKITVANYVDYEAVKKYTLTVEASDGSLTDTGTVTINVSNVNENPVINDLDGDSVAFTINSGDNVSLDQSVPATITDPNSRVFELDTLTVAGLNADEVVSVKSFGSGAGEISVSGNEISYEGTVIATFVGGSGNNLVVTFNSSATQAASSALLQSLVYTNSNASATPATSSFTIQVVDADGDTSNLATVSIVLAADVVAADDFYTTDRETAITLNPSVLANDGNLPVVANRRLNYTAATDSTPNDGTWNDSSSYSWNYNTSSVVYQASPTTNRPGITGAYTFNGNSSSGAVFSAGSLDVFNESSSATFELWVKPSDLTGKEVLLESGAGGNGMAVYLDDSSINFSVKYNSAYTISSALTSNDISDFMHVVAVIELKDGDDRIALYVNSTKVAEDSSVILPDWSGGNDAELGNSASSLIPNLVPFSGDIAAVKFYESKAFTDAEVQENYKDIAIGTSLEVKTIDTTGAKGNVTLNPDGSISYDPNGQFNNLTEGQSALDTFTYTAEDRIGNSSTGTVTITVNGLNYAPTTSGLAQQNLDEDFTTYTIDLKNSFEDVETTDANLIYTVSGNSNIGVSIDSNGIATITATTADWNGTESITFEAEDEGGKKVNTTTNFVVTPVNDAPTTIGLADYNRGEDFTTFFIDLKPIFADAETADADLIYTFSGNSNIGVSIDANGIATISSNTDNWFGTETITFEVEDEGGLKVSTSADFIISSVNDLPVITFGTGADTATAKVEEKSTDTLMITAVDDGSLTYSITGGRDAAMFKINAATGELAFVSGPPNYFFDPPTGEDDDNLYVVQVTVTDNLGATDVQTITVEIVPLSPAMGFLAVVEDGVLTMSAEEEIGVKEYRIYNAETGELLETIAANGGPYTYDLPEGVENVKVTVVDHNGMKQTFNPENGNVLTVFIDLQKGWNLIAMPGANADLSELERVTTGQFWGWNGSGYEVAKSLPACQGMWVYASEDVQTTIVVDKVETDFNLQPGWNMVGPTENVYAPEEAKAVFSWTEKYNELLESDILIQGIGYWMFVAE